MDSTFSTNAVQLSFIRNNRVNLYGEFPEMDVMRKNCLWILITQFTLNLNNCAILRKPGSHGVLKLTTTCLFYGH